MLVTTPSNCWVKYSTEATRRGTYVPFFPFGSHLNHFSQFFVSYRGRFIAHIFFFQHSSDFGRPLYFFLSHVKPSRCHTLTLLKNCSHYFCYHLANYRCIIMKSLGLFFRNNTRFTLLANLA